MGKIFLYHRHFIANETLQFLLDVSNFAVISQLTR